MGPPHAPITLAGRVVNIGFGWIFLITGASYTANLASLLVVADNVAGIADIEDLISQPETNLCVDSHSAKSAYEILFPELVGRIVAKNGKARALADLDTGICSAVAIPKSELELAHSHGNLCSLAAVGDPLRRESLAFPVSKDFASRLAPLVARCHSSGRSAPPRVATGCEPNVRRFRCAHSSTAMWQAARREPLCHDSQSCTPD